MSTHHLVIDIILWAIAAHWTVMLVTETTRIRRIRCEAFAQWQQRHPMMARRQAD